MILQALKEYYDRVALSSGDRIAPFGWETKEIPFIVVLSEDGDFVTIEDTREGDGKKKRAKSFQVPQGEKKTVAIKANLLWGTAGYVFGVPSGKKMKKLDAEKAEKLRTRCNEQKDAFIRRIEEDLPGVSEAEKIVRFLKKVPLSQLEACSNWSEIAEEDPIISFRFQNKSMVCDLDSIRKSLERKSQKASCADSAVCLVTGEDETIERLHPSIKGVWGGQPTGGNIVSFNLKAFESYLKTQGNNAPIGAKATFAYTTGLNTLLSKDSKQRMQVGDASTVFWSEKQTNFESAFSSYFSEPPKDDPAFLTEKIRGLFAAVNSGKFMTDEGETKFYILGLSPNSARISVRFWHHGTVGEFANKICQHFKDLEITKPPGEPEHYSLWRLLVNISTQDKSENIPPNLAGEFMRAILANTPYPASVLQAAIRRIRSDTERRVKPVRAALIKGFLNRFYRQNKSNNYKELSVSLDKDQPSIGYQLGRLFAALAKIQEEAQGSLNASIKERFYGAACSSPVTVFANLLRLKNHHLAKFSNPRRKVYFEKLLGEIMSHYFDFPAHLDLHEQGRFAIGYYHQWQDFFAKNENNENQIQTEE